MRPTFTPFFLINFLVLFLLISSCGESDKEISSKIHSEKYSFVPNGTSNFELFAKPLKDTSKETIDYELKAFNHTNRSLKILFYHCIANYGIRSTGGMIVPQNFHCNATTPYFQLFLPTENLNTR